MKQRIPKAIYNKELREQAVKQVTEDGLSANEAARRLSLPPSTLANWVKVAKAGKLGEIGKAQRPPRRPIHHSDQGSQYCAHEYRKLLDQFGMVASMSCRGNCYDNAPMESFWGLLKNELVHHQRFKTRTEAIQPITEYIEVFYRWQRKQARLGYLSPAAFERQFYEKKLAACVRWCPLLTTDLTIIVPSD